MCAAAASKVLWKVYTSKLVEGRSLHSRTCSAAAAPQQVKGMPWHDCLEPI